MKIHRPLEPGTLRMAYFRGLFVSSHFNDRVDGISMASLGNRHASGSVKKRNFLL